MDANAALAATEELLLGRLGSVRTVKPSTLARDAYASQTDEQRRMAVLVKARFEVEPVRLERTTAIGPVTASLAVHELEVRVRWAFSTESEVDADSRRELRAEILEKLEECRRALTWPGNLRETLAGVPTGLVGQALDSRGGARIVREDWPARIVVAEAQFVGRILDTLPVSA